MENPMSNYDCQCENCKFVERRDNDCHRYNVPVERVEEFDSLLQSICDAKFGSAAWYDLNDELDAEFGEFMY